MPEKFKKTRTLEDGTIIDVEEGEQEAPLISEEGVTAAVEEPVVEIADSQPEPEVEHEELVSISEDKPEKGTSREASNAQIAMMEALQSQAAQKSWAVEHPDPLAQNKVPVSRAERRKLIKDEIHRLSRGEEKVYYQRRLW